MRRYWLSIFLALFGISGIAGYYVVGASEEPPAFKLETMEGDPEAAAPIRITGNFANRIKANIFQITATGSRYLPDEGLLDRPHPLWMDYPFYRQLLEDHRGFMRKKWVESNMYADEQRLVYADVVTRSNRATSYSILLDLLDRESGRTIHKEMEMPTPDTNDWAVVCDVQVVGKELHVLVQKRVGNGGEMALMYVDHVFDLEGSYMRDVPLDFKSSKPKFEVRFMGGNGEAEAKHYAGFWSEEHDASDLDANGNPRLIYRTFVFRYETGQITAIGEARREKLYNQEFQYVHQVENDALYVARVDNDKQSIEVVRHDLVTKRQSDFELKFESLGASSLQMIRIVADRIYLLLLDPRSSGNLIVALDGSNGKVIYKGKITPEDNSDKLRAASHDWQATNIEFMY
ncbi:hypothetical protein ACFFSY_21145 [Paenibacillus aurantiacus]|uniref:Uncharacterized protein n=1 Tax=Paenibacillus aurantiacus TaxID=1936118 RepID=A0ABV5KTA2_9BACL